MFVRSAAAVFLAASAFTRSTLAEVITITQYPSTCKAIYTSGSRSVTVVQSTITVTPIQYNDAAWNSGTPFVLEIEPDGLYNPVYGRDVQQRSWLTPNGNTSTNPLFAGQYKIRNGQLMTVNGSYLSTDLGVESEPFSISTTPGTISTTFTFKDDILNWTSPRFTKGRAQFYKLPVGLIDNAQVLCKFIGPMEPQRSWTPIALRARPCDGVNPLSSTSAPVTGFVSVSTSMIMEGMSSGPPVQYSSNGPPPYSNSPVSSSSAVPAPVISLTSNSSVLPSANSPSAYPGQSSSSSSSRDMPSVSTPAAYTRTSSSSAMSSVSTPAAYSRSVSSSLASPSSSLPQSTPAAYTRTSSSPLDSVSSSQVPPIYGSPTPSSSPSSNVPSSSSLSFASSGSPIGPINPPYGATTSSSSISTSMSISSGGPKSSASSTSSSPIVTSSPSSSLSLPPVYTDGTPIGPNNPSISVSQSGSSSSSLRSTSSSVSPSFSSSASSSSALPPVYTPPSSSAAPSSSSSSSFSSSSSLSLPPVYPGESSTSSSQSSSSSLAVSSSTPIPDQYPGSSTSSASSSSSMLSPPVYTGQPQLCPGGNNSVYINAAGHAYTIYCDMDAAPEAYGPPADLDFPACIQACDYDPRCGAVGHLGVATCYFKPTPQSYFPGAARLAVRLAGPPIYPTQFGSSSGSSSSSMTSSSSAPVQYGVTTTTSTTNSTSSSSSSSAAQTSTSSSMSSSASPSSSLSSTVPEQYEQTTTSTSSSLSSSSSPSSTSSEVPEQYEQTTTTTTSSSSLSSTSSEVPEQYEQTTTTTSSSSSSSSSPIITTTTTTTTSSSSSSTIASTTSGRLPYSEYLVLPSPTPCDFGGPPYIAEDDSYCELDLPFDMTLYGTTSRKTYPSINGYISLNRGSSQFLAKQFPYPGTNFPDNVVAPFFDDLYMYGNLSTSQWIFYQIDGGKVTYEYYVARSAEMESIYHFTVAYDSAVPNTFTFRYISVGSVEEGDTGMNGAVAFVGMQGLDASGTKQAYQYSWRETKIEPGMMLVCSGTTNSCVAALP